jgi:acetylornithine/succinyldiaminopimelate/putrescine aminotransferase
VLFETDCLHGFAVWVCGHTGGFVVRYINHRVAKVFFCNNVVTCPLITK